MSSTRKITESMITHRAVRALAARQSGSLILPSDDSYNDTRTVWNGAFDRYPDVIVRSAHEEDVMHAVTVAREHGMQVAVRSGGHSMTAQSISDGGMVIDLSGMKTMEVDPVKRVARVQPGLTWGEYAQHAQAFGLATSSGDMASVGVGGLTVGGGIGWMVRKYGLTIDSLRSANVVTADGRLVTANEEENPDLFWGLRGGGGNFGIVTSLELDLHPAGMVLGGAVFYDAREAREVLRAYLPYAAEAPDELTTIATIMHAPPAPFIPPHMQGELVVAIMVCYTGDLDEGQRVVAPLRALGTPVADVTSRMPYPGMFEMTKEGAVRGLNHYGRSMFATQLDDTAIDTIVEYARIAPSLHAMAQIRVLGGAMSCVADDATAFAHRDKAIMFTIINSWRDPGESDQRQAWTDQFWDAIRPHASGVYVNFLGDEGEERIRDAYKPATYRRLAALKAKYDPTNFFRLNQNIQPAVEAVSDDEQIDLAA